MSDDALLTRSLWLPVGRANFYSYTMNAWQREPLLAGAATADLESALIADDTYAPLLQVSVVRRVVEVLPRSFGYDRVAACRLARSDPHIPGRPTEITMTLRPAQAALPPLCPQWATNQGLIAAGITQVALRVDEDGFYTFSGELMAGGDAEVADVALGRHVGAVFGGSFSLEWQLASHERTTPPDSSADEDDAPGRTYNGLAADATGRASGGAPRPLGILTFSQLNTLFEGIFNDALTPAVFFEQYTWLRRYHEDAGPDDPRRRGRTTSTVRTVADLIGLLGTRRDARVGDNRLLTLRHFLAVTSRESLQQLKRSVESVRRGLLDEMMGILHRQSPLTQLSLDRSGDQERTPGTAVGANESQLRGYVMLAGAKLPLVANLFRSAEAAATRIMGDQATTPHEHDLVYRLREWRGLLDALEDNIRGLERAVEHAWMERLLYEQEQTRAEQEAMAEIERTRTTQPGGGAGGAGGSGAYNALILLCTVFAVLVGIVAVPSSDPQEPLWQRAESMWPLAAISFALSLIPAYVTIRRFRRELRGDTEGYGYEFAFRLDRIVDPVRVRQYLAASRRGALDAETLRGDRAAAARCPTLDQLRLDRPGGARIEYVSADSTLMKVHSVVRFRARKPGHLLRRTARFEVINEFLARRVSDCPQYVLRETRIFGDSPRELDPAEVLGLLTFVLDRAGLCFQAEEDRPLDAAHVLRFATDFFGSPSSLGPTASTAVPEPASR